ncbi:hypothetical protein [Streptomyces sp. 8N706]|uniref:hypothetical protein n=1 Tax=Streptomyces sp. 8N706 TaxID=3457416 RepID=UPI003FD6930A
MLRGVLEADPGTDRQVSPARDDIRGQPPGRSCAFELLDVAQDFFEEDPQREAGDRCAEAVVVAEPEGDMAVVDRVMAKRYGSANTSSSRFAASPHPPPLPCAVQKRVADTCAMLE